ncbi:MAG: hypothetical protein NZO16_07135, partial [Deltaproteobacteria bacterium]|nr:hypothetical protein [Deltaproteobacteria bacterium]
MFFSPERTFISYNGIIGTQNTCRVPLDIEESYRLDNSKVAFVGAGLHGNGRLERVISIYNLSGGTCTNTIQKISAPLNDPSIPVLSGCQKIFSKGLPEVYIFELRSSQEPTHLNYTIVGRDFTESITLSGSWFPILADGRILVAKPSELTSDGYRKINIYSLDGSNLKKVLEIPNEFRDIGYTFKGRYYTVLRHDDGRKFVIDCTNEKFELVELPESSSVIQRSYVDSLQFTTLERINHPVITKNREKLLVLGGGGSRRYSLVLAHGSLTSSGSYSRLDQNEGYNLVTFQPLDLDGAKAYFSAVLRECFDAMNTPGIHGAARGGPSVKKEYWESALENLSHRLHEFGFSIHGINRKDSALKLDSGETIKIYTFEVSLNGHRFSVEISPVQS